MGDERIGNLDRSSAKPVTARAPGEFHARSAGETLAHVAGKLRGRETKSRGP
jgi:hypothetical protein